MNYFESLKTNWRTDYLMENPKKAAVLANAKIQGKATILPNSNNRALIIRTEEEVFLQSYDTIVCGWKNGILHKYWNDYSVTTLKHINEFLSEFTDYRFNKKEWLSL